jgi:uncharacterized membrane protein (UPF0127 family)
MCGRECAGSGGEIRLPAPSVVAMPSPAPSRLARLPARPLGVLWVAEARGVRARALGLARLDALPPDWALHIPRCRSVHTVGMRFALDLVWLDGEGRVVEVDSGVPRRRHVACRRARSVVELNAGRAEAFLVAGLGQPAPSVA